MIKQQLDRQSVKLINIGATKKNEILGTFSMSGLSSKISFYQKISEEFKIRLANKESLFQIIVVMVVFSFYHFLKKLKKEYPDAKFVGQKTNGELASYFASADVFVFPSKTETFGIVCIESLMAGTPVAGYADCPGTMDIFKLANGKSIGCLDKDLKKAALTALKADRDNCKEFAKQFTWKRCAEIFINNTAVN